MIKNIYHFIIIFSFVVFGPCLTYAQAVSTGFFVLIEDKTGCTNLIASLSSGEKYCLPNDPVITSVEFESVSDIKYDKASRMKYINLKLSHEGFKILKTLIGRLPDSKLALVIDNKVVGIFDRKGKGLNRIMPIKGDSPNLHWIHDKLQKPKP